MMRDAIDERPPVAAVVTAVVVALAATLFLASANLTAAVAAAIAIPCFVISGYTGSRRALAAGSGALVLAVVMVGVAGGSPDVVVASAVLAVVAWDVLDHGISLGEHVGRAARSHRSLLVHSGATLLVGVLLAGAGLIALAVIPGGWPIMALVFAVIAGVFALVALDRGS